MRAPAAAFGVCAAATLCVIVLGAYVRLTDAGLGCPDWPGCYGQLLGVPETAGEIARAEQLYPARPVETGKAWREMLHRYAAGLLGLAIMALALAAFFGARRRAAATALAALLVLQALLGMWTVSLLLKPLIVTLHLLGGMGLLAMLVWLGLDAANYAPPRLARARRLLWPAAAALAVLVAQIALGGWTSANYAALACPDFPTCRGQWWPAGMDFAAGFQLWGPLGVNYEYGVFDDAARTAVHFAHRLGALAAAAVIGFAAAAACTAPDRRVRLAGLAALGLLAAQVALGLSNVLLQLPLPVALAHNGVAALLLATLAALVHMLKSSVAASSNATH